MLDKQVLLDMDGVLVDFTKGACSFHGVRNPYTKNSPNKSRYEIWEYFLLTFEEFFQGMDEEFWAGLPKTDEADDIVDMLDDHVGLHNVCALSHAVNSPGIHEGKVRWMNKHYPDIPVLISSASANHDAPPKHFLAAKNRLLIDDHQDNVLRFVEHGGCGVTVPRPWNDYHHKEDEGIEHIKAGLASFLSETEVDMSSM